MCQKKGVMHHRARQNASEFVSMATEANEISTPQSEDSRSRSQFVILAATIANQHLFNHCMFF